MLFILKDDQAPKGKGRLFCMEKACLGGERLFTHYTPAGLLHINPVTLKRSVGYRVIQILRLFIYMLTKGIARYT